MAPAKRRLRDVMTAFSPLGDTLAISAGDGRIKTWDTASGRLLLELGGMAPPEGAVTPTNGDGHLAVQLRCLAWSPARPPPSAKKSKKKGEQAGAPLLAAGTAGGDVQAWDSALGELRWRTSDCHAGGVAALAFAPGGSVVYSAGADGGVCELEGSSGQLRTRFAAGKHPLTCLALAPDGGRLLVASAEVKLFDAVSRKRICKYAGHATPVRAAAFTLEGTHALTAAEGERQLVLWPCEAGGKGGEAAGALAMEDPAVAVGCAGGGAAGAALRVVALSEVGEVYVWEGQDVAELLASTPVRIQSSQSERGNKGQAAVQRGGAAPILAARLVEGSQGGRGAAVVARGSSAKPHFERVPLDGAAGSITLREVVPGALLAAPQSARAEAPGEGQAEGPHVLGPEATGGAQTRAHVAAEGGAPKASGKKKRPAPSDAEELPTATASGRGEASEDGPEGLAEQTLEEQLAALGLAPDGNELLRRDSGGGREGGQLAAGAPRADSVQVLLQQALQAEDGVLLDRCLSVQDSKVVNNTVRRLRAPQAVKLLSSAVAKFHSRPSQGTMLVPWIRAVLLHHAAFLMSAPAAQPSLMALFQTIDARLSVLQPLLALSGRLDLILTQMKARQTSVQVAEDLEASQEAAVVYEERDSDVEEEEVMDAMAGSSESEDEEELDEADEWETDDDMGGGSQGEDAVDDDDEDDLGF